MSKSWWGGIPLFIKLAGFFVLFYLLLQIPVIPFGIQIIYLFLALVAIFLYIGQEDERIESFLSFFRDTRPAVVWARRLVVVIFPLLVGWVTLGALLPKYLPPFQLFVLHPTPPEEVFKIVVPPWVLEWKAEDVEKGKTIYEKNCVYCHGKDLDGNGPQAGGFNYPTRPVSFKDQGTIATLTLPYVFWKVKEGGIQNQFNSAMPSWGKGVYSAQETVHTGDLSDEEMWRVIQYIYKASGKQPAKF